MVKKSILHKTYIFNVVLNIRTVRTFTDIYNTVESKCMDLAKGGGVGNGKGAWFLSGRIDTSYFLKDLKPLVKAFL